jgi:hypothetical protein
MCRRVDCAKCGRPTFAGCGMHVEQVLGNVPPAERCRCREERAEERAKTAPTGGGTEAKSWLRRLLGE